MRIVEVRQNKFVLYTKQGKVVIQTSNLLVARRLLNGSTDSKRDRPAKDTS